MNQIKTQKREYFIDFLKTLAIIFIIIDNAAIIGAEECGLQPTNVKLLYGESFGVGQGVPIFLFISGGLFVKGCEKNDIQSLKQCYTIKTIIKKYLRFLIPIGIAFPIKMIILGCVNGWGMNVLTGLGSGTGAYYISIVLQLVVVCPLIYFLIKKLNWGGVAICFGISTIYDLICGATKLDDAIYKQFIFRFVFMISAGIYICLCVKNKIKYKGYIALPSFAVGLTLLILTYYYNLPMHVNHRGYQDCTLANLYAIPIISLLVRKFKMSKQVGWSYIGKATFNIFLAQNILHTFPKQIIVANHFALQVLFNEFVSLSTGWCFGFGEHYLSNFCCKKIDDYKRNENKNQK